MAAAVDLDTREGPITVRLGEGAADAPSARPLSPARARSSISSTRSASGMPGAPPAPVATPPKHDSEELDPVAADMEKKAADMRDLLGEEPEGNVVPGIEDDVLWTLMRRFDTQINHVLSPARSPVNEPDLRMTNLPQVAFRSDTLKSNFERVFSSAGPQLARGATEIIRLTDWTNWPARTGTYCAAYFVAWWFGYAMVTLGIFACVLACFPSTRRWLFPPAIPPPGSKPVPGTGPTNLSGDQTVIGSSRHRSRAEQVEERAFEARAIFEAYAQAVVIGSTGSKAKGGNSEVGHKTESPESDEDDDDVVLDEKGDPIASKHVAKDPTDDMAHNTEVVGGSKLVAKDKRDAEKAARLEAKRKRDRLVAKMAKNTETGLGGIADFIEILQNTLSPPPPYPETYARFKLSAVAFLIPALAVHFIPTQLFGRAASFALGAALWGRPLASRGLQLILRLDTHLKEQLDPRNSILSGAPTNAQLVLYLLRAAESMGDPLPPPPELSTSAGQKALTDTAPDAQAGDDDLNEAKRKEANGDKVQAAGHRAKAGAKRHLAKAFRKVGRKVAGWHGDVAVDGKEKPIASQFKTQLLYRKFGMSPDAFACKLNGKAGHMLVDSEAERIAWVALDADAPDDDNVWDANAIVELTKASVSVPRLLAGFVGGVAVDSLGLIMRFAGPPVPQGQPDPNIVSLQSVERRDPLFNRLIAIGPQRWEQL